MSGPSRPSLPASSSEFNLPGSSTSASSGSAPTGDALGPLLLRLRRPSLLAPKAYFSESRIHSPLATSFIASRDSSNGLTSEESESDRDRDRWMEGSTSSENVTPPDPEKEEIDEDTKMKSEVSRSPSIPSHIDDIQLEQLPSPGPSSITHDPPHPLKQPRVLSLRTESKPDESEVQSEAQFQRLLASSSFAPAQPKTSRAPSDRGRYPEEAGNDDSQRDSTPSDDGDEEPDSALFIPPSSDPICISKPSTPAPSSANGDDVWMSESPGVAPMEVDAYGSPSSFSNVSTSQWRYTPPPTTSAIRTNKRKLDDRFDPYPTSSKRRAVSPSLSSLRESRPSLVSPIHSRPRTPSTSRAPMSIPINTNLVSTTSGHSTVSSPTISQPTPISYGRPSIGFGAGSGMASSPTMRSCMGLASPVLRPLPRSGKRGEEEQRQIDGAGEAVGGLSLE